MTGSDTAASVKDELATVIAAYNDRDIDGLARLLVGAALWVPNLVECAAATREDVETLLRSPYQTLRVELLLGDDPVGVAECRIDGGGEPVTIVAERSAQGRRELRVYLDPARLPCAPSR